MGNYVGSLTLKSTAVGCDEIHRFTITEMRCVRTSGQFAEGTVVYTSLTNAPMELTVSMLILRKRLRTTLGGTSRRPVMRSHAQEAVHWVMYAPTSIRLTSIVFPKRLKVVHRVTQDNTRMRTRRQRKCIQEHRCCMLVQHRFLSLRSTFSCLACKTCFEETVQFFVRTFNARSLSARTAI